ncbi:MAG: acetyl-CoA carboxylase biotin carboxylase subunit [Candidatus Eremiobacteraeota bacterium]|nr:acetyl-CoA carboxylase biotin carboxylase subunit [Candidatus Eremiobacteraeota bacterium]MBV8499949.1 acetyl-CoA carboxylase biotin carboxylase subunit [Candidatus Eremiobacteraeota bacterium]
MFGKILVANRGEIAVRIIRTAREMGIETVAVYSDADRAALHVELADEAYSLGPAAPSQSYLNSEKIIDCARRSGAEAIHPGYGFLAENGGFARSVVAAGLEWIGPHPGAIDAMGDKLRARQLMHDAGVPIVPGARDAVPDARAARAAAKTYGLPLALKAAGGGGGKGLKVAHSIEEVESAFETARREAEAYFNSGTIYAERYLDNPKHVELQVLADRHGNAVHVGERDCSLQRRHQKLWEETPAHIPKNVREAMRAAGVRAARAIEYDSVGTIECLVSGDAFYFLEMNTRIQVEHTVSEMISGLDLIREQIRVAAGEPLGYTQAEIRFRGFAIEARVNAEDPMQNFRPAAGTIGAYREPGGLGVRIDSAAYPGWTIPEQYDSLIAKLVVWAPTRAQAIARLLRALDEYAIEGVPTTLPLLRALCDYAPVAEATYGTATLEAFAHTWRLAVQNGVARGAQARRVTAATAPARPRRLAPRLGAMRTRGTSASGNDVTSPMHGLVVEIGVAVGDTVAEGQVVAVIEAMKMMNEIRAQRAGTVTAVHVGAGTGVESGTPLLTLS